jgi:polysaccharide export outer membrane protein
LNFPALVVALVICSFNGGCHSIGFRAEVTTPLPPVDAPNELAKVALPSYVIEPPDVLIMDITRIVPRGAQRILPQDILMIQATNTLPDQAIAGAYPVEMDGVVNLGPGYGAVRVAGMLPAEARQAVETHLGRILNQPVVSLSVLQSSARQQITGEHLVWPDGTVSLGIYGNVFVTGATIPESRRRIQQHLSQYLIDPEVSVDISGFNSKTYYIITEGAGFGDGVNRFPITGNETVLDAISQINGLSQVSSKKIWVSRPAPAGTGCDQILPVDWVAITKGGSTATNYQILPGDRVFVSQDHMVAFDTALGKLLAPAERVLGFTLLGTQTIQAVNRFPKGYLQPNPVVVQ